MPDTPSRAELVRRLAAVSRRETTRIGASQAPEEQGQSADDEARAEAVVRELEALELYSAPPPSRAATALRHPIVVGVLLAIISGVLASVLLPALTQVWQDRPRELALKRGLVTQIAREATKASDGAIASLEPASNRSDAVERVLDRWRTQASIIGSQLSTYFPENRVRVKWKNFMGAMNVFLQDVQYHGELARDGNNLVAVHFGHARFDDPDSEQARKDFIAGDYVVDAATDASVLFLYERDQIAGDVLAAEAAGFSHGVWIFS
jgi:hypothetical protein